MQTEKEKDNKDIILDNLNIVCHGIIKDFRPGNQFASWKNTYIGLKSIKNDSAKFYMGIDLWIQITENQLIGRIDNTMAEDMKYNFPWITNFLEIKKLVK
jgi:hypothetical protein